MFSNFEKKLKQYLESIYFLPVLALLTLISWAITNFSNLSFSFSIPSLFLLVIVFIMCLVKAKPVHLMGLFMLFYGGSNILNSTFKTPDLILIISMGIPTAIFVIYRLFETKFYRHIKVLFSDKLIFFFLIMVVMMFISIIYSPDKFATFGGASSMALCLALYIIGNYVIDKNEQNRRTVLYSLITFSIIIGIEYFIKVFVVLATSENFDIFWELFQTKKINVGWDHAVHTCVIVNLAIAFSAYLLFTSNNVKEKVFILVSMLFGLLTEIFSFSRAAYLSLALIVAAICVIGAIYLKKTKVIIWFLIILFVSLIVLCIVLYRLNILVPFIMHFIDKGLSLSGREGLWGMSIELFKDNWLLGTGWASSKYYINTILDRPEATYHNYILQASTIGIFGIILALVVIFFIIKRVCKKNLYDLCAISCVIMYVLNGLIDTLFFSAILMSVLCMLIAMSDIGKQKNKEDVLSETAFKNI